jgi:hypothetical protein
MTSNASRHDGRNLPSSSWINEAKRLVTFIGDEQQASR